MTTDSAAGMTPRTRWTNRHGEVFREVVWTEDDGLRLKTGVREEAARQIEREAVAAAQTQADEAAIASSTANLVIAFRRWCKRKSVEPPSVDDYRVILDEAAFLASHDGEPS